MKPKKILVLGSSGQVGSQLVRNLLDCGFMVTEFDIKVCKNQDLRIISNRYLDEAVSACDFVFFLAFDVGGAHYLERFQRSAEFLQNNMLIMLNTFECIKKHKRPFIFASTQMSSISSSPYGVLKGLGEFYTTALEGIFVKFWNSYGLEKELEKAHVITDFIRMADSDRRIIMRTDGAETRQFLHVSDSADCLISLMNSYSDIRSDEELHITSFKWTKIIDLANKIAKKFPGTEIIPSLKKDDVQHGIVNEPNKNILRFWQPKISLDEGILRVMSSMNVA